MSFPVRTKGSEATKNNAALSPPCASPRSLPSLRSLPPPSSEVPGGFIPPHGGYAKLYSFQKAQIVYDATVHFCDKFIARNDRTRDQMIQAARLGKQNVVEGSQASGTSKEMEIKLTNVARASLEELLGIPRSRRPPRTHDTSEDQSQECVMRQGVEVPPSPPVPKPASRATEAGTHARQGPLRVYSRPAKPKPVRRIG
jgi:hypothetical protein